MESKIIYQVEKADLINLFNEIIEQREQAKNSQVYYSLKEVLKITGKNRSTLWNWERKGYLKPVRMGKTLLYLKSDLDAIRNPKRG